MQKEENAGGHEHQLFSRKNIHILRALKNVENLPCYHGFFRTPLNTHKIRRYYLQISTIS